jgi:hypothetical protein
MTEIRRSEQAAVSREAIDEQGRRGGPTEQLMQVRESDLEPYVGLGYLSKLFRFIAVFLAILLVAEIATGLIAQGRAAIPTLLAEASRLIVLAGLLWGAGDLALLLIDVGHDVRAARILLGRQVAHHVTVHHPTVPAARPGDQPMSTAPSERPADLRREFEPRAAARPADLPADYRRDR